MTKLIMDVCSFCKQEAIHSQSKIFTCGDSDCCVKYYKALEDVKSFLWNQELKEIKKTKPKPKKTKRGRPKKK